MNSIMDCIPFVSFIVYIHEPEQIPLEKVATHMNVFRGFYWTGGSVQCVDPGKFPMCLTWSKRKPCFLESKTRFSDECHENPSTVILDFLYVTEAETEHRFSGSFNMIELLQKKTITISAGNNNTLMNVD